MLNKSTQNNSHYKMHQLPSGLIPGDFNTELIGIRETRKVFAICNGNTIPFAEVHPTLRTIIYAQMLSDDAAMEDLRHMSPDEALEEFAFCVYGDADSSPDFTETYNVGASENFRCGGDCKCLKWASKQIKINDRALTLREVQVIQELASDKPDKLIADELGISQNTLNQHKKNMFDKAEVQSRTGLVKKAIQERVIR